MSRWTPEAEAKLTRLWHEGKTASEIAVELPELPGSERRPAQKPTRNMVLGKARRMRLPARPSPIIREAAQ